MQDKRCSKCRETLPLDQFWRNKRAKDGCQSSCKACHSQCVTAWRKNNKEALRPGRLKGKARYRIKYAEKLKADAKRYREANRTAIQQRQQKYYEAHPEKFMQYKQERRARMADAVVEKVDRTVVFDRDEWTCQLCLAPVDAGLKWPDPWSKSLDHAIPLAKGGSHTYDNVQLAHLGCNLAKRDRKNKPASRSLE